MKILVTGYKGFIGSNMINHLKDHEVYGFEWGEELPVIKDIDYVIHMGANSSTTERDIEKIMRQNYDFSVWLLSECIKYKVNFQYSSSASVYGLNAEFKEDSPLDPKTPYAWSKFLFERYVSNLNKLLSEHIKIQGFRYFNVFGPGEDHKLDQASPYHKFAKQYKETGKVKVFENSENYLRDFVHVNQVCKTHIDFFDVEESGIWNVGTGNPTSFLEVALSIAPYHAIEFIPMPEILKQGYQEYTCADMAKTKLTLERYKK
jgi:ADP-L-glycero-D-manno-heptose 6-epimerase